MNCWYLLVIVLVAVGCYSNSLHGNFVHDDIPAIVLNKGNSWYNNCIVPEVFEFSKASIIHFENLKRK